MTPIPLGILALSGVFSSGAYDLLETTTLTTSASSVTFSGLGAYSDYKHLQLRIVARSNYNGTQRPMDIYFNSDNSGTNYSSHFMSTYSGAVNSEARTSQSNITETVSFPASSAASGVFGAAIIDILDFASINKNTTTRSLNGYQGGSTNGAGIAFSSGLWNSTAAVTSITMQGYAAQTGFAAGSRFSLMGVK
jgi:hypothetical protein